jgi:hypothetical protein
LGSFLAVAWFDFTWSVLAPRFPLILQHPISRFFYLKDNSGVSDVLRKEWEYAQRSD